MTDATELDEAGQPGSPGIVLSSGRLGIASVSCALLLVALIPIIDERCSDGVGLVHTVAMGERTMVFGAKDISESNAAKKYIIGKPVCVNVPVADRVLQPGRRDNLIDEDAGRLEPAALDDGANSFMRRIVRCAAGSMLDADHKSGGSSVIVNYKIPRPIVVRSGYGAPIGFFGRTAVHWLSAQATANKIRAFMGADGFLLPLSQLGKVASSYPQCPSEHAEYDRGDCGNDAVCVVKPINDARTRVRHRAYMFTCILALLAATYLLYAFVVGGGESRCDKQ